MWTLGDFTPYCLSLLGVFICGGGGIAPSDRWQCLRNREENDGLSVWLESKSAHMFFHQFVALRTAGRHDGAKHRRQALSSYAYLRARHGTTEPPNTQPRFIVGDDDLTMTTCRLSRAAGRRESGRMDSLLKLKARPLSDSPDQRAPIGQVTCPNCRVVMPRVSLKNGEEKDLNEAVYRCPKCSTETRRWIKI